MPASSPAYAAATISAMSASGRARGQRLDALVS